MGSPFSDHTGSAIPDLPEGNDYAVVVAHPDDEVLWFSSVLAKARKIILCYGDYTPNPALGPGRRKVIEQFPYPHVHFLDLPEGEFLDSADWENPRLDRAGIAIRDPMVGRRYEQNFDLLLTHLKPLLNDVNTVFTHNPWGEYGHEDHVQVHHAIKAIMLPRGGRLMMPADVKPKSLKLMSKTVSSIVPKAFTRSIDRERASAIKQLYESHGCWTYFKDWHPPEQESFLLCSNDCLR